MFYTVGMPIPEAARILAAKLRSRAWRRATRRSLTPTDEAVAGTVLAHVAAWRASTFALEAGGAAGSSGNGLEESCHQAPRLLIKAESDQKLLQLRRAKARSKPRTRFLLPWSRQTRQATQILPRRRPLLMASRLSSPEFWISLR